MPVAFLTSFIDTEFSVVVRDSDSLWSGWLRNHAGALPGPDWLGLTLGMGAASDRMAGLSAEMDCCDWTVAYGGPWIPWILS